MLEVVLLDSLPGIEVVFGHRLDDESLVLAEEEEATRLALRLTCLEDHLTVGLGVERLAKDLIVVAVLLTEEGENIGGVLSDLDVFIDHKTGLHFSTFDRHAVLSAIFG